MKFAADIRKIILFKISKFILFDVASCRHLSRTDLGIRIRISLNFFNLIIKALCNLSTLPNDKFL